MNWRRKASIQRAFAGLPVIHEPAYYLLQRMFGRLRRPPDPFPMLEAAVELVQFLAEAGTKVEGARVMEVGTGRQVDLPIAFYLCGAKSITTFDLHRYLKPALVLSSVRMIAQDRQRAAKILERVSPPDAVLRRLDALATATNAKQALHRAGIEYRAPADAGRTGLPAQSIDIQISYTVFEHIPRKVLGEILREANRILSPGGVTLHHVDPSDHFAHEDKSILPINFLQFPDDEWSKLAGNQFSYHNRLRADDYAALYAECGHQVLLWKPYIDKASEQAIRNGFPLHERFRDYPPEVLGTVVLQILSKPAGRAARPGA